MPRNGPTKINKVLEYCKSKEWDVVFDKNCLDVCYPDGDKDGVKRIYVNSKQTKENQLYVLLHEIGHMIENQNKSWYTKKYSGLSFSKQSLTHKIALLEEELEAWNKGLRLARRLGITINERRFLSIKSRSVNSYIRDMFKSKKSY